MEVICSIELLYDVKTWGICKNGGSRPGLRYGLVKKTNGGSRSGLRYGFIADPGPLSENLRENNNRHTKDGKIIRIRHTRVGPIWEWYSDKKVRNVGNKVLLDIVRLGGRRNKTR